MSERDGRNQSEELRALRQEEITDLPPAVGAELAAGVVGASLLIQWLT